MHPQIDLTLYLGGTRSGKSQHAEAQAQDWGGTVLYVATAVARPDDMTMQERIRKHQLRRPRTWHTLECNLHLADELARYLPQLPSAAAPCPPLILLDCVTLWVSSILFSLPDPLDPVMAENAVCAEVEALLELMAQKSCRWVLVSGETGLGGIAADPLTRNFCDVLGTANQLFAAQARKVFLVVAGRLLQLP